MLLTEVVGNYLDMYMGGLSNKGIIQHKPAQLDVGVDCHNYAPISYQEVKEIITKQHLIK